MKTFETNYEPFIAQKSTAIPSRIEDSGILVDKNDIPTLLASLRSVLENQEIRKELTQPGHDRAKKFSRESLERHLGSAFEQALKAMVE